jgi:exosortase/archaeosortase family protein
MLDNPSMARRMTNILVKLLPLFAFIIPTIILYFLDPTVFEKTWKGRMFYVFFLWLVSLEIILNWEGLQTEKIKRVRYLRTGAFIVAFLLPTVYVVVSNFYGLNAMVENLALESGMKPLWANVMPLSIEYLVFATLFSLVILLEYGVRGLKTHSISTLFLTVIGVIYIIDNVYQQNFTPFQIIVPTTASLAANVLNFLGYRTTWLGINNGMPGLVATGSHGSWGAQIAWPCSGVESLLIYAVTILLFLKNSAIPWKQRIVYFVFGAAVTYFINILRIVTIFIIGVNGGDAMAFHNVYGQLYSVSWIVFYPLLIMGSRAFWWKIRYNATVKNNLMHAS